MADHTQLLQAALDLIDEGIILLDPQSNVVFWNQAAVALTGHAAEPLLSRPCPPDLYVVDRQHRDHARAAAEARSQDPDDNAHARSGWNVAGYAEQSISLQTPSVNELLEQPTLVALRHRLGHTAPAMLRRLSLQTPDGAPIGSALLFHSVEDPQALPHGDCGNSVAILRSQADMEDRLEAAHHQWLTHQVPFGLLWITVDQAATLRKTHGRDASEAMMRILEQSLLRGLNPGESLGRWGCGEFLVLSHERSAALLLEHAQLLVGRARVADFRWWGDRVSLTISIGAAHVQPAETIQSLLHRAQQAMQAAIFAGGNRVTASREPSCSQS